MLWELFWLAAELILGTFRFVTHRQLFSLADESSWGFGHILALLLSALPLWSFFGSLQNSTYTLLRMDEDVTAMRSMKEIGSLDCHAWFFGFINFVFGTALTFASTSVFEFSASALISPDAWEGSDILYRRTGFTIIKYIVFISCGKLVAMFFTAVALVFHFRLLSCPSLCLWWSGLLMKWTSPSQRRARVGVWIAFILILLAIQGCVYVAIYWWTSLPILDDRSHLTRT